MMDLTNIGSKQIKILKDSSRLISSYNDCNIESDSSFFLTSWCSGLGNLNLREISKIKFNPILKLCEIFKVLFSNSNIKSLKILDNKKNKKSYDNLIISYLDEKNFKNNYYYEKYFGLHSNTLKKTLLILIPLNKININKKYYNLNNLSIIDIRYDNYFKNFFFTTIKIFIILTYSLINKKLYSNKISNSTFNIFLKKEILKKIKQKAIKRLIFPYEAQPHQHELVKYLYKKTKIKIIGYMHTALPPLPADYIKRRGAPKKILVNGIIQKQIMNKFLGWKKNEVNNIVSMRYKPKLILHFQSKIFLPYDFSSSAQIIKSLEKLIYNSKKNYLPKFKVKNHPSKIHSKKHLKLEKKINDILKKYKFKLANSLKNKNISIFVGSTASIAECLERGITALHITENSLFESLNPKLWPSILATQLFNNVFKYKVKNQNKGYIIKISNISNNNKKYLNYFN